MSQKYVRLTGDKDNPASHIEVEELEGNNRYRVTIDGEAHELEAFPTVGRVTLLRDGRSLDLSVEERGATTYVRLPQGRAKHEILDHRIYELEVAMGGGPGAAKPELTSPMAGKVVMVSVEVGQEVAAGDTLLIVEAMKMENEIRAEADTVIKAINVKADDLVESGQVLIEFDIEED